MRIKHQIALISILLTSGVAISSTDIEARVIGGETTTDSWPFMVFLEIGHSMCGGTLISSEHVLTAAHCVSDVSSSTITANIGSHNVLEATPIGVDSIEVHPCYKSSTVNNDLAILKLAAPVSQSPIEITTTEATYSVSSPSPYSVLGWGVTDTLIGVGSIPDILEQAVLNVVDYETCQNIYGNSLTNKMICATAYHDDSTAKDACQGDSGGPLIEEVSSGIFKQVGIVSWGINCGLPDYPGVYTDVSEFSDWINTQVANATVSTTGTAGSVSSSRAIFVTNDCNETIRKKSGGSLGYFLLLILVPLGFRRSYLKA